MYCSLETRNYTQSPDCIYIYIKYTLWSGISLAVAYNLTPNSLRAMSSGKKSIYFVTAIFAKSAELAAASGAPESKCLHIQLRATQPLRAVVTAPQRPGNPVWQSHCSTDPAPRMALPCCWSPLRLSGRAGRSRDGLSSRKTISQPLLVENSKSLSPQGKLSFTSKWGALGSALTVAFVLTTCYIQQVLTNHAN